MSKLSFRARALDASKPMPIYMAEELPDLPDYSAINRAVPQMPSGMEKEEECEHHLQRAICAGLIIPTPEVSDITDKDTYDKTYPANYKQPRQLIHMQPFTMEQDIPDYDMDSEDERWFDMQAKKLDLNPLKFEEMMDRLEKSSSQTAVKIHEAKALLKEDDDLITAVYDYWLNKRLKLQHPLILAVKTEQRAGIAINNPYLAFRRRTEKMQTRKNRKNDETSYEKMLKLRRDLSRAVTLLELIKKREKMKREYVHLTVEVFEKRYQAKDFAGAVAAEVMALKTSRPAFTPIFQNHYTNQSWNKATLKDDAIPRKEKRQYKKKKHKPMGHNRVSELGPSGMVGGASSDEEPTVAPVATPEPEEPEDEGQFAFRRNKLCTYHMPLSTEGNWPWCSKEENGLADTRYRYALTSLSNPKRCIGYARRRMGRGGRVVVDRLATDYLDDFWKQMDYTVYDSTIQLNQHQQEQQQQQPERCLSTDSFINLGVGNGMPRTDIKTEPPAVRTFSDECDDVAESSDITEPVQVKVDTKDYDEMLEMLQSVQKDCLHFRPKTPPPDYSPPCYLLPLDDVFTPSANNPFSLELQPIDDVAKLFTESSFISAPFALDYDIATEVPVTDTRQQQQVVSGGEPPYPNAPISLATAPTNTLTTRNPIQLNPPTDENANGVTGCSRFSVSDVPGGLSPAPSKKQCNVSSTLTSPKLNSVYLLPDVRSRANTTTTTEQPTIGNANGIVTSFEAGNRVRTKVQHHPYQYTRAIGNVPGTNNTLNLHTSAHTVMLNSHSANIFEIPMSTNDTDGVTVVGPKGVVNEPGSASPNNKTKAIVRKNNLVMEVT